MYRKICCFVAYNLLIVPIFVVCAYILVPFVKKIRNGLLGRMSMFNRLLKVNFEGVAKNKKIIWFHVASAGEFEQALPIISQMKNEYEKSFIIVTFFST